MHHVCFTPSLHSTISFSTQTVLEIAVFHTPTPTFEQDLEELFSVLKNTDGFKGASKGRVVDNNVYQFLIEWESVEFHDQAKQRADVNSKLCAVQKGAEREEMWYVKF